MKCYIIRDILPLYCDNLTSRESNKEIEKHLHYCEKCNNVYESMNRKYENIKKIEKNIDPLKKVNKQNKLKVGIAILLSVAVMSLVSKLKFVIKK